MMLLELFENLKGEGMTALSDQNSFNCGMGVESGREGHESLKEKMLLLKCNKEEIRKCILIYIDYLHIV